MPSAEVTLEIVDDVSADLRRYVEQSSHIIRELDSAAEPIVSFLNDVIRARRQGVEQARAELDRAVELERNRSDEQGHRTNYIDTDRLRGQLGNASASLNAARTVKERVVLQLQECRTAIGANNRAVAVVTDSTQSMLREKRQELLNYWTGAAQVRRESPVTPAASTAGTSGPASAPAIATPASIGTSLPGLPDGFRMIQLNAIDDTASHVSGPDDFGKGFSPEDLRWAHDAFLDVVLPVLSHGGTIDDLRARDTAEGRMGVRSYADTYHGFLGDTAIRLESNMKVVNGYHRIWVAKKMGLQSVPVRIR